MDETNPNNDNDSNDEMPWRVQLQRESGHRVDFANNRFKTRAEALEYVNGFLDYCDATGDRVYIQCFVPGSCGVWPQSGRWRDHAVVLDGIVWCRD